MQNEIQQTSGSEIGRPNMVNFFKYAPKSIMAGCLVGLLLAVAYVVLMPKKYEARWQIQMAKFVSNSNSNSLVEEPAALTQRLRLPTAYTSDVRQGCGLDDSLEPSEYLDGLLRVNVVKGAPESVEMKVVLLSSEQATKCADALIGMIVTQQRSAIELHLSGRQSQLAAYQKALYEEQRQLGRLKSTELGNFGYLAQLNQMSWLRARIDALKEEIALSQLHPAKLVAPIFAPSKPVSPKVGLSLVLGALLGALIGLLYALGREGVHKARLA